MHSSEEWPERGFLQIGLDPLENEWPEFPTAYCTLLRLYFDVCVSLMFSLSWNVAGLQLLLLQNALCNWEYGFENCLARTLLYLCM